MTLEQKQEIISKVITLLNEVLVIENESKVSLLSETNGKPLEMLTVKECVKTVNGLSEYTIRQLINKQKIPFIRTGEGKNGKILINKSDLLEYLKIIA